MILYLLCFLSDHDTCIGGITCDGDMGPNAWFCGMSCQEVKDFSNNFLKLHTIQKNKNRKLLFGCNLLMHQVASFSFFLFLFDCFFFK